MENIAKILNTNISTLDLEQVVDKFEDCIKESGKLRVCVTPVNCIVWARQNKKLERLYNTADMCLADGVPVVWASKFLGKPIKGRVTGLDLLPRFSQVSAEKGITFFFLGAKEGVGNKLAEKLMKIYPSIKIVGVYSPPFAETFSEEENKKMITMINKVKPNVLWVSLTAPKQDFWISEHFDELDVNIAIGVGGAFEVTAGLINRAPIWMQKYGLEWFYRFVQEPRRLFKRYFVEAPIFIPLVLFQKFKYLFADSVSELE